MQIQARRMAMLIGDVRPTTLDGVKSLAAQLRKEQGIKYSIALDLAAKAANCTNFRNARRVLPARGAALARPYVLLTIYWYDKEQRYRSGRETLKIELSKPILDICGKSALKRVRGFDDLRMVADDHFVCDTLAATQTYARKCICVAERSLRFMEHTGLLPSRDYRKAYLNGSAADKLPGSDHATYWIDPASKQYILVDEPYSRAPDEAKRAAWAARVGWQITKTSWPGMYYPYECDLYVATDGGSKYDLDNLVEKINTMPAPSRETDWSGESSASWDTFISPMAKTKQDVRRARCRGTIYPASNATTVPYSFSLGSSARRPAGKMGIEGHIEAGRIIKAVLWSDQSAYAVYNRMNSLRSTLEDWMALEIGRGQLEGPEFFDVYYHEAEGDNPYREMAKSRAGIVAMLGDLKLKLQAAYPDCAPLRKQLHRIDMSVSLIGKMNPADD
ncbi:MAG: DUF5623 domain-containing protein [Alphaproteobacteria bacterium]|nr:DUF5623 domain-containing protein [Alphaproteobacteria bacterium]MDE2110666.1 DUF5623 domain-containing protein [Alphaproteobacteria bacterium]MDE2494471.1 DUF5623 domain-containing protein [Alphaproteobacteria bacterium]